MDENERKKGMNQGIWLAVQELAHAGRWTQAAEELVSLYSSAASDVYKRQSGASPRRAMDAGRRGTGVFLWIDRG